MVSVMTAAERRSMLAVMLPSLFPEDAPPITHTTPAQQKERDEASALFTRRYAGGSGAALVTRAARLQTPKRRHWGRLLAEGT